MNAMIFAAGLGTRLKPLTDDRPKALVEVNGKSLLEHNIINLKRAGFDHIVVNVHHFGEQIISFLRSPEFLERINALDGSGAGCDLVIKISDERGHLLDTGGGIRKALPLFGNDEPVLIHNVDIISTVPLREIYLSHKTSGADATLCVAERQTSRYLLFDSDMRMHGWKNVKTGEVKGEEAENMLAFSGIHVLDQNLFKDLESFPKDVFSITDFYIETCGKNIYRGYKLPEETEWVDCGKVESLEKAAEILRNNRK